jgi:fumarate reductase flavoprotein subunit
MNGSQTKGVENIGADIAVVGAGGAGLAAALAAAEKGASVVVLEKRRAPGGNTALAQAFFAAESPAQERMSINAPKDVLFKMAMDYAHWEINPRIVRAFIEKSGDTARWLEEKGLEIEQIPAYPPSIVIRTFHWPKGQGAEVVRLLVKECKALGVRIIRRATAKNILMNAKGEVRGIRALSEDKALEILARSVIIATGGYGGNKELLKKYCPLYTDDIRSMGLPHMGDGIIMAGEIGAAAEGMGIVQMEGPIFQGSRNGRSICQQPTTIWVNNRGERFADETAAFNHFESVNAVLQQPGKVSYSLFDEQIKLQIIEKINKKLLKFRGLLNRSRDASPPDLTKDLILEADKGTVKIADSWDAIAEWIGADPRALKSTVDAYNAGCDRGHDEIFVKERRYLVPLRTPPYYAMRCFPVFLTTIGGIKINHHMEVLNHQDDAIPGLYAAGNDTGGWEPNTYNAVLSGSTFGFALNSGRIAGEQAVQYTFGRK